MLTSPSAEPPLGLAELERGCPVFTPGALARRWRLPRARIYALVQDGTLAHFRVGRTIRIPAWAVDEHEQAATASPRPATTGDAP